ncbi:MAG: choice-of-anchor L domain-containing protein [Bacteroidota bacterium]
MKKFLLSFILSFFILNAFSQIANQPSDISICDDDGDGFAFFDLTINDALVLGSQNSIDFVVTYHNTQMDADNGTNALASPYINSANPEVIFVRIEAVATGNFDTTSFTITVLPSPSPSAQIPDLVVCDDDGDGFSVFDLTQNDAVIVNGEPNQTVSYYETEIDAITGTSPIISVLSYSNVVASIQTIYARVESLSSGCSAIVSFNLVADPNCGSDPIISINDANAPESYLSPEELVINVLVPEDNLVDNFSSQVNGNPTDLETKSYGYFNRGDVLNFPFEEGIVLTTGVAFQGGNTVSDNLVSTNNSQPGDVDLENALNVTNTNDAAFIKFNFVPVGDEISFRYLLASEEYDGSTECSFADSFAFLLREVGTTEYTNLAVLPDGTPVNVTNVNNAANCASNPEFFEGYNIGDTNYGGRTTVLTASANVIPNTTYEIKLVIADQGDSIWDSAIFLEGDSFNLGNSDIGLIAVNAFYDTNNNGSLDNDESSFTNGTFTYEKNNDGTINTVNTSTGSFTIISTDENDTYDINFDANDDLNSCYSQTVTAFDDVSVSFGEVALVDFPIQDNLTCEDLAVYLINPFTAPRPGFEHTNVLIIQNLIGANIPSGSVEFTLDDNLLINGTQVSNPNLTVTTTATGFTLDFINLAPGTSETVDITLFTPVAVPLDEVVTNAASYTTATNDTDLDNNSASLSEVVVGSYDPNDKMEAHGPKIVYNDFVSSDEYLYYTIRFQNLGTAEAIFVRIDDVLDTQLDEDTFEMLRSSHDYVVTRTDNNLEWFFDNINLPAEQDDAAGSIGYVHFRIKPKSGYAVGDIIPNNAAIYFDFNAPIITNTFNTEFIEPLSIEDNSIVGFGLYPNPANNTVTVQLNDAIGRDYSLEIFDIQGKRLYSARINATTAIDISAFRTGMYFVKLSHDDASQIGKLLVD